MPTLAQVASTTSETFVLNQTVTSNPVIEPLSGPADIDDLLDYFPDTVYQQGRDTHLYRFLTALCGDAGAALLKKQSYYARLSTEAEIVSFQDLDNFYTTNFKFRRLADESYEFDPSSQSLSSDEWNEAQQKDNMYRARMLDFFNATRLGNSPAGMALAGQSGSGVDVDIIEHYRYVFDQFSDDPLGITPYGTTVSTNEYVLFPRVLDQEGNGDEDFTFQTTRELVPVFTPPTLPTASRPITAPSVDLSVAYTWETTTDAKLLPEYERNMVDILDRLGPVGAYATIFEDQIRVTDVSAAAFGSSTRIEMIRYVQGQPDVSWPTVDETGNFFIVGGQEQPSGSMYGGTRELPIVFHTLESMYGYTNLALADSTYNSNSFYAGSISAPYLRYRSQQTGNFLSILLAIYPFLNNLPTSETFGVNQALAINNTPLTLTGGVL